MEFKSLIISFIGLMFVICGGIIFWLKRALITSTEGAVNRLNDEIAQAKAKEGELNKRLAEAQEELTKRRTEAREMTDKMRTQAEEESKTEREKIISKSRQEGEEIVNKALAAKEKIKFDLEKENDIRMVRYSMEILNSILSEKAKGALDDSLTADFIANLKSTDMTRISSDLMEASVTSLQPLTAEKLKQLKDVLKEKLGRDIKINATVDPQVGGGIVVKFGTMALDGTVQNLIREAGTDLVAREEAKV